MSENTPVLMISRTPDNRVETMVDLVHLGDPYMAGMMLAFAARVIANAFRDVANLPESHIEQIEAEMLKAFTKELQLGDYGEQKSTRRIDEPENPPDTDGQ